MVRKVILLLLMFPTVCAANQATTQYKRDKILFQFLLNEPSGSTWVDTSTHVYKLLTQGTGDAIITGKTGNAISMNGSGSTKLTDISGTPENTIQDYTLAVSFRLNGNMDVNLSMLFFAQDFAVDAWDLGVVRGSGSSTYLRHRLTINANIDTVDDLTGTIVISTGVWHHAVFTRTSGGVKDMYLDGKFDTSVATKVSAWSIAKIIEIGSTSGGTTRFLNGDLDEITFWKTAFTAGEARQLYSEWIGRKAKFLQ